MTVIQFDPCEGGESREITLHDSESVLDGLLREGINIPFGCRSGVCQSCLLTAVEGELPPASQVGLKSSQVDRGLFLSCSCIPNSGLKVQAADLSSELLDARVLELFPLNEHIFCLRLEKCIDYRPGQYATLWQLEGVARSYSLASHPEKDNYLEFHIKRIPYGAFSDWAFENLKKGDVVKVQGPMGACYYNDVDSEQPILLSGIGTGLSPLYGIVVDAINSSHTGPIKVYIGAKNASNFYFVDALHALNERHSNIEIAFVSQEGSEDIQSPCFQQGDIYEFCKTQVGDFSGYAVYLCGAESFVRKMKKMCFLNGAAMKDIQADPFIPFQA
ncbi:MAG: 2Fe-2S iron-sulfur cluster binding domain-containing protein [Agarilytica sp.]